MTIAIVGRSAAQGKFGLGVLSHSPLLGGAQVLARTEAGAVAVLGGLPKGSDALGLNLLHGGFTAAHALTVVAANAGSGGEPALAMIGLHGAPAGAGGAKAGDADHLVISPAGDAAARACSAAFGERADDPLEMRLLAALEGALQVLGDAWARGGSAALIVHGARAYSDVDVRADFDEAPLAQLRRIFDEQHLVDLYFAERRRNPQSTEFADEFIARIKRERAQGSRA